MTSLHNTLRDNKNKLVPVALTTVMGLGATACSSEMPGQGREGEVNRTITSVSFEDGANVRETPIKGDADANNLITTLPELIEVETPDGVRTYEDNNGTWYGVPAESLADQVQDQDVKASILKDDDGQVWVNEVNATPERDQ